MQEIIVTLVVIFIIAHHHLLMMITLPWHSCLEPRGSAEVLPKRLHLVNYHDEMIMMDNLDSVEDYQERKSSPQAPKGQRRSWLMQRRS